MFPSAKLLALSNRIYCLLLYLYPASFRQEYGYHMAQLFRDDVRGTMQESGGVAVVGLWFLAFFDLLKTAVAEHFWEIFHMPIEKLTRWSGAAAALGGLLLAIGVISIARLTRWANGIETAVAGSWLAVITALLMVLGLFGLYKCLPTTIGHLNTLAFMAAAGGLLTLHVGWVIGVWTNNFGNRFDVAAAASFVFATLWLAGFIGMGILAMTTRALGRWSFTPLLVVATFVMAVSFGMGVPPNSFMVTVLVSIYAMSWLLLGVALWQTHQEPQEPGLFA